MGREERGNPLWYFKEALGLPEERGIHLPYFFHAGETGTAHTGHPNTIYFYSLTYALDKVYIFPVRCRFRGHSSGSEHDGRPALQLVSDRTRLCDATSPRGQRAG